MAASEMEAVLVTKIEQARNILKRVIEDHQSFFKDSEFDCDTTAFNAGAVWSSIVSAHDALKMPEKVFDDFITNELEDAMREKPHNTTNDHGSDMPPAGFA